MNVCIVIDINCMKVQLINSSRTSNFTSGSESIEITEAVYLERFILSTFIYNKNQVDIFVQ